ncbi:MAG TPA: tetratricopeptide repeat protein [Chryseolinea sp.]|nr:tetratricopeptide repeat protein [Chryseolinea sp.]
MPSLIPGYEYDIFISYRHKDNKGGHWVTEFVEALRTELESTFKEDISIYFDENPHDGLLETDQVDRSLEGKLKCLILIPIISRTYCDPTSFAWRHEFLAFRDVAVKDKFGLEVQLADGNFTSRILPVQIHDLSEEDLTLFEKENGGPIRAISFTFKSLGVNRPLTPSDSRSESSSKTVYRDQINKTANAIYRVVHALRSGQQRSPGKTADQRRIAAPVRNAGWVWSELIRRNVFRAAFAYLIVALAFRQMIIILTGLVNLHYLFSYYLDWILVGFFPIAVILAWLFEKSPTGFIRTSSLESTENPYTPAQKKPLTGNTIIVLLSTVVLLQFVFFYLVRQNFFGPARGNEKSIAVLPFENRSDELTDEYFADGLTDEIIEHLSILGDLHVINRQSILDYRGKELSYKRIASELDVSNILTGSVRRSGDLIKITATLIECSTNKYLWGATFQRTNKDIMSIQSEIARNIAGVLKVRINELENAKLDDWPTQNPTAYDYYVKGRTLYYQYKSSSNDQAIDQFKMAIALDPNYALAWAGLGDAYSQMHNRFGKEVSWIDSSIVAGQKAVGLDSTSSDSYKALANAYSYAKKYDTAFLLLKKAVALNPTNAPAVGNLGTSYFFRGDLPQALRWEKKAAGLNPKGAIPFQIVGWIYRLLGDLQQAESWLEKSLELNATSHWDTYEMLAYTYLSQGRKQDARKLVTEMLQNMQPDSRTYEIAGLIDHFAGDKTQAKEYFQRSIELNESYIDDPSTTSPIGLGQILLEEGKNVEADVYLSHALEINLNEIELRPQDDDPPFYIASIYAIRGQRELALKWLDKAIEANWIDYAQIQHGPWFEKLRNDPAVVAKISLLQKKAEAMRQKAEGM